MNRRIFFRGKRLDNHEWVYGYYVLNNKVSFIETVNLEEDYDIINSVDTATVGQYTGSNDKCDNKIFEGDIVDVKFFEDYSKHYICSFKNSSFVLYHYVEGSKEICSLSSVCSCDAEYAVIGNIYDNPELVESCVGSSLELDLCSFCESDVLHVSDI